jgi:6-pyruvoyltetrahydropterin/6-carboxytetrahydropterin synthase
MFCTGIKSSFTARHMLVGDFGDETLPHEHQYVVEWICSVHKLDENGFGVDIDLLKDKLELVLSRLDHVLLNDLPFFQNTQTSIENTSRYITATLREELEKEHYPVTSIAQSEVRIWESDDAWASFREEWS